MAEEVWLRGVQSAECRCGGAEEVETAVVGRDGLLMEWTGAEEVAEFVVALTEPRR